MGQVANVVGHHRAADACMFGPANHAGFEERSVDNQLRTAVEQIEQGHFSLWSVKLVLLLHSNPRHPPAIQFLAILPDPFSFRLLWFSFWLFTVLICLLLL